LPETINGSPGAYQKRGVSPPTLKPGVSVTQGFDDLGGHYNIPFLSNFWHCDAA